MALFLVACYNLTKQGCGAQTLSMQNIFKLIGNPSLYFVVVARRGFPASSPAPGLIM